MKPLISIIVPVYNVCAYLERCVSSLVNNSWENKEIILVDDGSTDNSGELCDDLASKHACVSVLHKKNGGLSSARNAGLEIANGDYIGFVDSDDWVETDMLKILVQNIEEKDADVSACDFIDDFGNAASYEITRGKVHVFDQNELYHMTIDSVHFAGYACNKIFRRSIIADKRFDETLSSCEDLDFISKIFSNCKRGVYEQVGLYHYYHHSQSMTGERNYSYRKIAVIDVYERLLDLYAKVCPECLYIVRANYLKININVKGRYLCSKVEQPEILERLNKNIAKFYPIVINDKNVGIGTKLNVFISKAMPRVLLRLKQYVLQLKQQK